MRYATGLPFIVLLSVGMFGCRTGKLTGVARDQYVVYESTDVKRLRAISLWTGVTALPAPGRFTVQLVDRTPGDDPGVTELLELQNESAPWRVLDGATPDLVRVVRELTSRIAGDRERWIVAVNPTVVAIGQLPATRPVNRSSGLNERALIVDGQVECPGRVRLITDADLSVPVSELIWLPKWPEPEDRPKPIRPSPDHVIRLPAPQTLRQVLDEKAWVARP